MTKAEHQEIPGMFEGRIIPLIIRLALPILLGGIFQLVYNVTDTLWVSWIDKTDPTYVSATGLIFPVIMFAIAFSNGLSVGLSSLVARAIGEKNAHTLSKAAESGLFVAGVISAIMLFSNYCFLDEIVTLLGAKGLLFDRTREYFLFLIPCGVFIFFSSVLSGILQGEGKMIHLMVSMVIGTLANIILDPLLIFTFGMGLQGAALATTIAQGIGFVYLLTVFARNHSTVKIEWKLSNINPPTIGQIFAVGFPSALSFIFLSIYIVFFNKVVISISEFAFTAFTLYFRLEGLVMMPLFGISAALITMVGQNGGRGLFSRVKKIWHRAILVGSVSTGFLGLLFWLLSPYLYPFFNTIPEVLSFTSEITGILLLSLFIGNVGIIAPAIYQGLGHPIPSIVISFLRLFVFIIPLVYLFSYLFPGNVTSISFALVIGNILTVIIIISWMEVTLKRLQEGKLKVLQAS